MEPQATAPSLLPAGEQSRVSSPATLIGEEEMSAREERMTILRMVEEGKISPEEGATLLSAIGENTESQQRAPSSTSDETPWLRIRVTDIVTGQQKVNVNVPVGIVRFGLRFVPESANVDVPAILDALNSGMKGRIVDVTADEDGKRVEIFIE
jgi:hypothetical protein